MKKLSLGYSLIDFAGMILFFLLCSGFIISYYGSGFRLVMLAVLCGILFLKNSPNIMRYIGNKENTAGLSVLVLIFLPLAFISMLITGDSFSGIIFFIITLVFVMAYSFDKIIKLFCDVIYFLAIYSLVIFFGGLFLPNILDKLPIAYNISGFPMRNALFAVFPMLYGARNYGLFWEPGAFQAYLNIALLLTLFIRKKNDFKYFIIYGLTVLTTMSTVGYISYAMIIIFYFLYNSITKENDNKKIFKYFLVIGLIFLLTILVLNLILPFEMRSIFGKFSSSHSGYGTTSTRIESIIVPLKEFIKLPLFGVGYANIREVMIAERGHNVVSCTPVNWFAAYGAVCGFIYLFGLYKITSLTSKNMFINISVLILFLLIISAQDFTYNPSIVMFCFYGYFLKDNRFKRKVFKLFRVPN